MSLTIAALIYRTDEIPDRALSLGFAVALGGWDVPNPRLLIAGLPDFPGFAAALYESGAPREEEAEHAIDLFDDELSPPALVLDAAEREGRDGEELSPLYALVYAEDFLHDDAWRLDDEGYQRRFVRDGEDGIEIGVETPDDSDVRVLDAAEIEGATEAEEQARIDAAVRPHRGSTFLSGALGRNVLAALVRASFDVERKVTVRLAEPDPASIEATARALAEVLGRTPGRGAFPPPVTASGARAPAQIAAFARSYDWHDPHDPEDLYRELSIGGVTGNLRFLREAEIAAFRADPAWEPPSKEPLYPVARTVPTALGGGGPEAMFLAVAPDGDTLFRLRPGKRPEPAGPTFSELLLYLALGWKKRSAFEEDLIGALMLRARLRAESASR